MNYTFKDLGILHYIRNNNNDMEEVKKSLKIDTHSKSSYYRWVKKYKDIFPHIEEIEKQFNEDLKKANESKLIEDKKKSIKRKKIWEAYDKKRFV